MISGIYVAKIFLALVQAIQFSSFDFISVRLNPLNYLMDETFLRSVAQWLLIDIRILNDLHDTNKLSKVGKLPST